MHIYIAEGCQESVVNILFIIEVIANQGVIDKSSILLMMTRL